MPATNATRTSPPSGRRTRFCIGRTDRRGGRRIRRGGNGRFLRTADGRSRRKPVVADRGDEVAAVGRRSSLRNTCFADIWVVVRAARSPPETHRLHLAVYIG